MPIALRDQRQFAVLLALLLFICLGGCAKPPASSTSPDPHTATRQRILIAAERMIGTRYILGGESPRGVDCSGLVQYAYGQAGVRVPRTARQQFRASQPRRKILPGDLLFFRTGKTRRVTHVGIYAGNGKMIHASSGKRRVRKVSLNKRYWRKRLVSGTTFLSTGKTSIALAKP